MLHPTLDSCMMDSCLARTTFIFGRLLDRKCMASAKRPPISEVDFLRLTQNHGELTQKLRVLDLVPASSCITEHALHVAQCWIHLADEHLRDARASLRSRRRRSAYSRAYYAIYNSSKALRYLSTGWVSLHGDDHKKASDLPDDFPDVDQWSATITTLYENRLRADYDNWSITRQSLKPSASKCVNSAAEFRMLTKTYLRLKLGFEI
jgi:hypothetical protein